MPPEFRTERLFAAPRETVWDAWTIPDQLAQWMGPKGSTSESVTADIRTGGMHHWRMDMPGGGAMYGRADYREVTPPSRLVWVHGFADAEGNRVAMPFAENWPLTMLTIVTFAEEGEGTRVVLTWAPLDASAVEEQVFADNIPSMTGGWNGSFEQLDEFLAR